MHDDAAQPLGEVREVPPEAIRSRSSANIRSPPNPRVPMTERHLAERYMSAMTEYIARIARIERLRLMSESGIQRKKTTEIAP